MAPRTWETRELPLLEVIAAAEQEGPTYALPSDEVGRRAGLDQMAAQMGRRELHRAGYIRGADVSSHDGWGLINIKLEERGRRQVGQWPSENGYDELIRLLDGRLESTDDEDERGSLRRLRDAATDVGRGAVSALIYDLGRGNGGMR